MEFCQPCLGQDHERFVLCCVVKGPVGSVVGEGGHDPEVNLREGHLPEGTGVDRHRDQGDVGVGRLLKKTVRHREIEKFTYFFRIKIYCVSWCLFCPTDSPFLFLLNILDHACKCLGLQNHKDLPFCLAAQSSFISLVVCLSVCLSVSWLQYLCKKVTFRVSNGN